MSEDNTTPREQLKTVIEAAIEAKHEQCTNSDLAEDTYVGGVNLNGAAIADVVLDAMEQVGCVVLVLKQLSDVEHDQQVFVPARQRKEAGYSQFAQTYVDYGFLNDVEVRFVPVVINDEMARLPRRR